MSDISPVLNLPYIQPSQAQKHVTHNEALRLLDRIVQAVVADRDRTDPPATPAEGDRHIVADGGSGDWAGHDREIAVRDGGVWAFVAPRPGWRAHVLAEAAEVIFDATAGWGGSGTLRTERLGVATDADATNRLAVAAEASLFTHAGAGHRMVLNKAASGDTASLLMQSGWSGRAEVGLAGGDDLTVKVSADGSVWTTALSVAGGSGAVDVAGLSVAGQGAYHRGNLLGPVALSGGLPTGAVLERGSNASGDYLRLADGTQICWSPALSSGEVTTANGVLYQSTSVTWTFPAAFATGYPPCVSGSTANATRWVSLGPPGLASAFFRVNSATLSTSASDVRLVAIGRWS